MRGSFEFSERLEAERQLFASWTSSSSKNSRRRIRRSSTRRWRWCRRTP